MYGVQTIKIFNILIMFCDWLDIPFVSGTFGGNLYVYFAWNGKETISEREQVTLALILGIVTVVGSFIFLASRAIPEPDRETEQSIWEACLDYFKSAWHMSQKLPVLLMMPSMAFQGTGNRKGKFHEFRKG